MNATMEELGVLICVAARWQQAWPTVLHNWIVGAFCLVEGALLGEANYRWLDSLSGGGLGRLDQEKDGYSLAG